MIIEQLDKPQHRHFSCGQCRFVGRLRNLDLYVCKNAHVRPSESTLADTVIARFGDNTADYASGSGGVAHFQMEREQDPTETRPKPLGLAEAARRGVRAGILPATWIR